MVILKANLRPTPRRNRRTRDDAHPFGRLDLPHAALPNTAPHRLKPIVPQLPQEKRVPVIAIGGIANWEDAVEFIMAGASAVQVGTATFANPNAMVEIIDGLSSFMKRKGYRRLEEMRGLIQK